MRKKLLGFVLAICLILPCNFLLSACGNQDDGITDCAYIQFIPDQDSEVVQYTSRMYADADNAHIYLFDSEQSRDAGWEANYLLKISFKRNLGVDASLSALCVDIEKYSSMEIRIKKSYYNSSKKVYLNDVDITSKANSAISKAPYIVGEFWSDGVYYFEDFGLVRGNTTNFINKIEYK